MLPLALTALSLAAAELTPPPPPPDVEPQVQEPRRQEPQPQPKAPWLFLYTAPLKLLFGDLNAELELHVNEDLAVFADGGVSMIVGEWEAGARWYFPPLQGTGPWRVFVDGHVTQRHAEVELQGIGSGFGATAGVRLIAFSGLAFSLGARGDVITSSAGASLLPQLRVSVGWGF